MGHDCKSLIRCCTLILLKTLSFLTGKAPFHKYRLLDLQQVLPSGLRPERPENCSEPLFNLIQATWAHDEDLRPGFNELLPQLESLEKKFHDANSIGIGERLNPELEGAIAQRCQQKADMKAAQFNQLPSARPSITSTVAGVFTVWCH